MVAWTPLPYSVTSTSARIADPQRPRTRLRTDATDGPERATTTRKDGIPQVIVGTGGEDLDTLATNGNAHSNGNVVTAQDKAFGVLNLQLGPHGYSWKYQPVLAGPSFSNSALTYADSGSGTCR
jgi:hypothetical protein